MKMKQKLIASAIAVSAIAGFAIPSAQAAEVAASVSAANMYYWRGFDLGGGAALIADVNVSESGFIAGVWTSSGDSATDGLGGTEYDLYVGYSGSVGDFTYGVSVVSYIYPTLGEKVDDETPSAVKPGEYVEVIPTVGYGPLKVTYYDAVAAEHAPLADDSYSYVTAELIFEKFAIKYGQHAQDYAETGTLDGVSHLDVTYKFNDKLSFTVGSVLEANDLDEQDKELNFVATLSLPIL